LRPLLPFFSSFFFPGSCSALPSRFFGGLPWRFVRLCGGLFLSIEGPAHSGAPGEGHGSLSAFPSFFLVTGGSGVPFFCEALLSLPAEVFPPETDAVTLIRFSDIFFSPFPRSFRNPTLSFGLGSSLFLSFAGFLPGFFFFSQLAFS